ncbi:hypothetical protein JRI60_06230 [Archangium violaceum]|uniref:hypothetical protein n=1 Tax=Archangium violaceum TaxID=83451 RepID=UPI001951543E|nr:hypothetical protein [Archangium violaceum]QRN98639.1 hypothetical protein JRI60_06230 [Archangium violaceum]
MRILARCLLAVVLGLPLLTGCNAEPEPGNNTPIDETPTEDGTAKTCTYNTVEYPEGYVFGSTGGVARCTSRVNGVCDFGPLAGKSCAASTDCQAICANGEWR